MVRPVRTLSQTRVRLVFAVVAALVMGLACQTGPHAATFLAGSLPAVPVPPGAPLAAPYDYYYGAAETQQLTSDYAAGASATFTVEHPKQVPSGHSLSELAVESPAMDYSYIEAGWIVTKNRPPRLFIFWWIKGAPQCYNQGCGYVAKGAGVQPGAKLRAGTTVTLTWQHVGDKWWLLVDGQRSGYYPDALWSGAFTETGFAQVFGEVAVKDGQPVCTDMGNGKAAARPTAAAVTDVSFVDGPPVALVKDVDARAHHYTLVLTGDTSMRYGGPGDC